ncbi:MAG TPA: ComF family protein [Nevskiaceae bacterium]
MRGRDVVRRLGAQLRMSLAPRHCAICRGHLPGATESLCPGCREDLPWMDGACPRCANARPDGSLCAACATQLPPQDYAIAAFHFTGAVRRSILQLKYHAAFAQAQWLGAGLAQAARERHAALPDWIVPIPLHARRLRGRGYNQALELARVVGKELGIPVVHAVLRRHRATVDQIGQSRNARRRNLRGAFHAAPVIAGRHIALLDDVMTTGSTFGEAARCCRTAGAASVAAWAVARA